MLIYTAKQIRQWDEFTIENEPISSQNLIERAAKCCAQFLQNTFKNNESFYLFCGSGNNGGDGFAIARMLYVKGFDVTIFHQTENLKLSKEAEINLKKAQEISGISILDFIKVDDFQFNPSSVIVDCIFGIGLNRNLDGRFEEVILKINELPFPKIAIDVPSGLFVDTISPEESVIFQADHTLSFQSWKKSFLHPETGKYCGEVHILDIGLSNEFIKTEKSTNFVIDKNLIKNIYQSRTVFSHKGSFGKTLIVAGSYGKIGAAVLATKAALKSGSGITFTLAPKCGYEILQSTCPEAMFISGGIDFIDNINVDDDFVVGIGPGLGKERETEITLLNFLEIYRKPLVLDADALNIIAKTQENLKLMPKNSIITPHPKEFERLFGSTKNSFERLKLAQKKAVDLGVFIVLKDHHTQICTPGNKVFYNTTGNSGMAKGGSGDALLGIISSLLAQHYTSENAAIFGVWLHGKAGDFAAEKFSKEAMLPSDLINELGNVFQFLK